MNTTNEAPKRFEIGQVVYAPGFGRWERLTITEVCRFYEYKAVDKFGGICRVDHCKAITEAHPFFAELEAAK